MIVDQWDLIYSFLYLCPVLAMTDNIYVDHACSDWTIYLFGGIARCEILFGVRLFILLSNLTCRYFVSPLCLNLFLLNYSLFETDWMNLCLLHFISRLLISYCLLYLDYLTVDRELTSLLSMSYFEEYYSIFNHTFHYNFWLTSNAFYILFLL